MNKFQHLFNQLKEEHDYAKNYIKKEHEKGFLDINSATYQKASNVDFVGRSMAYSYDKKNKHIIYKYGKIEREEKPDYKKATLHTKVGFLTREIYYDKTNERLGFLYEGYIPQPKTKKPIYVRCYADRFKNKETKYDIVIAQINENEFSYAPIILGDHILEDNFKKLFVKEIETIYENQLEKFEKRNKEEGLTL